MKMTTDTRPISQRVAELGAAIDQLPKTAEKPAECVIDCTPLLADTPEDAVEMAELRRNEPWSTDHRSALADRVAVYWPGLQAWWVRQRHQRLVRALERDDAPSAIDARLLRCRFDIPGLTIGDGRVVQGLQRAQMSAVDALEAGRIEEAERGAAAMAETLNAIEWCRHTLRCDHPIAQWEDCAVAQVESVDKPALSPSASARTHPASKAHAGASETIRPTLAPGR